jgi:hypothetical protein
MSALVPHMSVPWMQIIMGRPVEFYESLSVL